MKIKVFSLSLSLSLSLSFFQHGIRAKWENIILSSLLV